MRGLIRSGLTAILLSAAVCAWASGPVMRGDYVEARTCSVYTGACHANGELVTTGREAMLVWHVSRGTSDGEKLDGLSAVAVIRSNDNLSVKGCTRDCVIWLDSRATKDQREALLDAIQMKFGCSMGRILAVKDAPIAFSRSGNDYSVHIPKVALLKTTRYSCDHCVMQHQVWYEPIVHLQSHIVAKAAVNEFKGSPELAASWCRNDENSAFVGEFAF